MIYFFLSLFQVASAAACEFSVKSLQDWQVQTIAIDSGKRCLLKLTPKHAKEAHRKYIFNDEGMAMVFVDNPKGSSTKNTASFGFFLLPTSGEVPQLVSEDPLVIKDSAGVEWRLVGGILTPQNCRSSFSKDVNVEDKNGFSIASCDGKFVLRNGYMLGEQAITDKKRNTEITGPNLKNCKLKNSEIFDYSEGKFEVRMKAGSQEKWTGLLRSKKACVDLVE
jgi:hypothetical protein